MCNFFLSWLIAFVLWITRVEIKNGIQQYLYFLAPTNHILRPRQIMLNFPIKKYYISQSRSTSQSGSASDFSIEKHFSIEKGFSIGSGAGLKNSKKAVLPQFGAPWATPYFPIFKIKLIYLLSYYLFFQNRFGLHNLFSKFVSKNA